MGFPCSHVTHQNQSATTVSKTWSWKIWEKKKASKQVAKHFCLSSWKQRDLGTLGDDASHHCSALSTKAVFKFSFRINNTFLDSLFRALQSHLYQRNNTGQTSVELKKKKIVSTVKTTNTKSSTEALFRLGYVQWVTDRRARRVGHWNVCFLQESSALVKQPGYF